MDRNPLHKKNEVDNKDDESKDWKLNKESFVEWFGMDEIIEPYSKAIGLDTSYTGSINGWAALAVVHGPEKVVTELNTNLATIQIVCGLLLSFTFPIMVSPPDSIANLEQYDPSVIAFGLFMSFCNIGLLLTIILGTIVELGLNSCGRSADVYRMILGIGIMPTCIYTLFTVSIASMGIGFGIAMYWFYGTTVSMIFSVTLCSFCIICNWISVKLVLPLGHVVHGWRKTAGTYDVRVPFEKFEKFSQMSRQYKQEMMLKK